MEKTIILTSEGLRTLEEELRDLKINRRKEVAERIKEARSQGDLSENAEYDYAKEEQAEIEARIAQIEKMLKNVEVINEDDIAQGITGLGSKIKILDLEIDEEFIFTIVGTMETDPANHRISNESPLGMALLGRKTGDDVEVPTPDGKVMYKILEIL